MSDRITILDKGYIQVLDSMGTDLDISRSARISYGKQDQDRTQEQDKKLINYLMKHYHTSPFETCQIRLQVKLPIFVARQWIRHRTWSVNEISGRYTELEEECYIPNPENIKAQSTANKQTSEGVLDSRELLALYIKEKCTNDFEHYKYLLKMGVSRETARIVLPLNTYTTMVFSVDLLNLLKFIKLRDHEGAQWEIRQYAYALSQITQKLWPWTYEAFCDHWINSTFISRHDQIDMLTYAEESNLNALKCILQEKFK